MDAARPNVRLRRGLIGAVAILGAALWILLTEPGWAFTVAERLAPNVVWRVRATQPLVGLSFDDGPDPVHTPKVLEILAKHEAKATFFLIGQRARAHPELVARIKAEDHEIANHYFMNGATLAHSDQEFRRCLAQTELAIGPLRDLKLFRPPGGVAWPSQLRAARAEGYTCVLGSAYPHDPAHPPVWYIRWLILKNLAPGAIVILHDGIADPARSIAALPDVLAGGTSRGFRFVAIGTLMSASGR